MKRTRFLVSVSLAAALGAAALAQDAAPRAQPVLGMKPAIVSDRAAAWTVTFADGRQRAVAAVPVAAPARVIDESAGGHDGAPALTMDARGAFVVAFARSHGSGARLRLFEWRNESWQRLAAPSTPESDNHHPAIAAGRRATWLAWVGSSTEPGGPIHETVYVARRLRNGWSPAEAVPAAPGTAMAPAILVLDDGSPVVVWAASDGNDAEVWLAHRDARGWTGPTRLTDNDVADIMPSLARSGRRVLIGWSRFQPDGYRPLAMRLNDSLRGERERLLDDRPGTGVTLTGGRTPGAIWSTSHGTTGRPLARTAEWRRGRFLEPRDLSAVNAAVATMTPDAQGAIVAWPHREGMAALRVASGPARQGANAPAYLRDAPSAPRARARSLELSDLTLPGSYRGFGDSITEGIVRRDGVVTVTGGYPAALGPLVTQFVGANSIIVINDGLGGERTDGGLGRIGAPLLNPTQYTLLMEGANDAIALIDAETAVGNLRGMILRIFQAGSFPVVATVTPRTAGGFIGELNPRVIAINDLLRPMARAELAHLVDMHSAFFRNPAYYSDVLHPNEEGYVLMAETWFRGLQPILSALLLQQDDEDATTTEEQLARLRAIAASRASVIR